MAEPQEKTVEMLVETLGLEGALCLMQAYKGKQITIPDGTGRAGTFSTWLDENLGVEGARKLRARCGGERLTMPMLKDQARHARNRLLIADYDSGMVILDLIHKYDISERQIRTILNCPAPDIVILSRPVDDRQLGLF